MIKVNFAGMGRMWTIVLVLVGWGLAVEPSVSSIVDHQIRVQLHPGEGLVQVHDRLDLPQDLRGGTVTFSLNSSARIEESGGLVVAEVKAYQTHRLFSVDLAPDQSGFELRYSLQPGLGHGSRVDEQGVFLSGASHWFPRFGDRLLSFTLEVASGSGWTAVSQGQRDALGHGRVRWTERQPQDDIYLVAGPFIEYQADAGEAQAMAFLRTADADLADRYLQATARYIDLYSKMLGPYPYAKFALVENTWETGYGMPSFTLLGSRVIRLPFIVHTSYPHEIVHNWWGNSVYVDYEQGNWSEGLTAYLADHHLREKRGRDIRHRRDALQKYRNYVSGDRDFPLTQFRAKHGETSEAVGYNKTMMVFHMLRLRLGDELFFTALRKFYENYRFRRAGWDQLIEAIEAASGLSLDSWFRQWLTRTGAPHLVTEGVGMSKKADGYAVKGTLRQQQASTAFEVDVTLELESVDGNTRSWRLPMAGRVLPFDLQFDERPRILRLDPRFDTFRLLDLSELPPTLSEAFAHPGLVFVMPRDLPPARRSQYERFIAGIDYLGGPTRTLFADDPLPAGVARWYLGRAQETPARLLRDAPAVTRSDNRIALDGQVFALDDMSASFAFRSVGEPVLWTILQPEEAPQVMARRLRHFGRYSYLLLDRGQAVARGQWPVVGSVASVNLQEAIPAANRGPVPAGQ